MVTRVRDVLILFLKYNLKNENYKMVVFDVFEAEDFNHIKLVDQKCLFLYMIKQHFRRIQFKPKLLLFFVFVCLYFFCVCFFCLFFLFF